jgi:amidophosphoribosyltransferase
VLTPGFPGGFTAGPDGRARREVGGEKCGVFGCWGEADPAKLAYFALFSLQHRGQESAGIAATDGATIERHTGMGLVANVFRQEHLAQLDEVAARRTALGGGGMPHGGVIGHNRYSTTGASDDGNTQPFTGVTSQGPVAIGHNGNVTNARLLRLELQQSGHAFHATSDTEVMLQLIAAERASGADDPLASALRRLDGAFSIVLLGKDRLEAARDPWGWRPLTIGRLASGRYVVASETIALDVVGAEIVRDVEPGEVVTIDDTGLSSRRFAEPAPRRASCVFEHVYFASPASVVFGGTVQRIREMLGERLAAEAPANADTVMPMPDSGRSAATGFARASGIPYREGIIPNRYVGRTFIKPTSDERVDAVRLKLNVVSDVVKDHRVVVVDDSIVRGTTTRIKMDQLREAGAKEIHLRISCPPITNPCYFGVDFADRDELVAANHSVEEIRAILGVDSLSFLSLDGLLDVATTTQCPPEHYCTACYSGEYRIPIADGLHKDILAKNC